MIKIEKLNPFGRMCISLGMLPSSYKESLTYEEQLLWLIRYLEETVIPTVNNNAEAVEELQNLYLELKSYVDEYFDNLDIQEEINNKLDDMAESGELTDIIAQYLGLAGILAFNTVADMKAAENLVNGSMCRTLGFHELNDKGGAFYKVRTITNEDVVDDISILSLTDNTLIAELIVNNEMNIKQFGAIEDGTTDDLTSFTKALSSCEKVILNNASYKVSDSITMLSNKKLIGNNSTIIGVSNENTIIGNNLTNIEIKGINFNTCYHAIYITDSSHLNFEDLSVSSSNWGLALELCDYYNFNNITFNQVRTETYSNKDGIHINGGSYGTITNIYGTTDDDLIALNADENTQDYGAITNVIIDNVRTINSQDYGETNSTYCGIKLLSHGSLIDNITIKNSVIGIDQENGIVITGFSDSNVKNVYVDNCTFIQNANHTKKIILIESIFDNIKFTNCDFVLNTGTYDSTFLGCEETYNYGNLIFENCNFIDKYDYQKNYLKLKGNFQNIILNNVKVNNTLTTSNYNRLITFESGTINNLVIDDVTLQNMDRLINFWSTGTIDNFVCNNIETDSHIANFINANGEVYHGSFTNIILRGNSPVIKIAKKQNDTYKCVLFADNISTSQNENIYLNDDGWKYNIRVIKGITNFEPQVKMKGDTYYNTSNDKLYLCVNTTWTALN